MRWTKSAESARFNRPYLEEALQGWRKSCRPYPSVFHAGRHGWRHAYNKEEFLAIVENGRCLPVTEVLMKKACSQKYEMEVVRDKADNCIIICSIENVDPMGVHTGDSINVVPALTYRSRISTMRNASIAVCAKSALKRAAPMCNLPSIRKMGGGRIEMNPKVAFFGFASKRPAIAKIAAGLAVGYTLDELMNDITGVTPASFELTIDYVTKFHALPLRNSWCVSTPP